MNLLSYHIVQGGSKMLAKIDKNDLSQTDQKNKKIHPGMKESPNSHFKVNKSVYKA